MVRRHPEEWRKRTVRRAIVGLLVGATLSGCTVSVPSAGPGPTSTSPAVTRSTSNQASSQLRWRDCQDGYECAELEVPLDWSSPQGEKISLALIRRRARKPNPIGSLLFNPGGPGEPGTDFLRQFLDSGKLPAEIADRFDLVSWDPRGTGKSSGIACLTDAEFTEPDPLPYPPTASARAAVVAQATAQQQACTKRFARIIPQVSTIATVRDLDAIRAALGDDRLNYVGFSYGTTIGLEYLKMFPSHVRAVVLDGVALPGSDPVTTAYAQMASFEANLDRFLDRCAANASCSFGNGDPRGTLLRFLGELAAGKRIPASYELPDPEGGSHRRDGTLGYTEAVAGIAAALYNELSWEMLEAGLAAATRPQNPDGHFLLMFRDLLRGRQLDGTWNHSAEANTAISCADQSERATSFFGDPARMTEWAKKLPVFGRFGAAGLPGCYQWPLARQPLTPLRRADLADAPGIVVVNSTHDPATPYANAKEAVALLPDARLVTWNGDDHTSFAQGHSCVDDAVVPYLIAQTMPTAGLRCPG